MVLPPLLPRRASGVLARCITSIQRRGNSILASSATAASSYNHTAQNILCCKTQNENNSYVTTTSPSSSLYLLHHHIRDINHGATTSINRYFSKYAVVDHSVAYQHVMSSSHGTQLELAIEEGRGKDDLPFDPFSQFLDEMGGTVEFDENYEVGDEEENNMRNDDIEEAEYEEYDEKNDNDGEGYQNQEYDHDNEEEEDEGPIYTNTGALYRPKSERMALRAGYPSGGKFAVILLAGFQHKVTVDDLLVVNKLKPVSTWSVGSTVTIKGDDILLMANQDKTLVGLPGVHGGEVDVMVEEITRDKTLVIFKKRRRKHSRRRNGFRREVTFLRVLDVRIPGEVTNDKVLDMEEEEDLRAAA